MRSNKHYKKYLAVLLAASLAAALFAGCGSGSDSDGTADSDSESTIDTSDMFTERDLTQTYDASDATEIKLTGDSAECDSKNVKIDGSTITISSKGTYILSGQLENGQIIVDADDEKVQIVLDNADITCEGSAALYVKSADKVFLTSAKDSENTLASTGDFANDDSDDNIDGAIFAKDDITINGQGTITVTCEADHGIVGKDDVRVTGGTLVVEAKGHAIAGKDSVRITGATIDITTEDDGIHAGSSDDDDAGFVYIESGNISISAGDDGIHANGECRIAGGDIDITKSYEGIEGAQIYVTDGNITLKSSDDGFNAAGGNDSSGFGGMGGDSFGGFGAGSDEYELNISGGTILVDADGDGLDSNGNLYISGGDILVYGPKDSANGALDYGEGCEGVISGGTIIACGASGMAENFSDSSTQGAIMVTVAQSNVTGDVTLYDADGNALISCSPTKSYNNVVISCPEIVDGATYTVTCGDYSTEVTMDGLIYGSDSMNFMTMGGGFGGFGGGRGGDMQMPGGDDFEAPDDMELPEDGEAPEMPDGMEAPDGETMPEVPDDSQMQGGQMPGGRDSQGMKQGRGGSMNGQDAQDGTDKTQSNSSNNTL